MDHHLHRTRGEEETPKGIGTYTGARNDAKEREGQGVATYPNGDVYDGLAASNDPAMYAAFLDALRKDFELSDCGELSWLLGCKVEQDRQAGTVRLTQEKYCNDVLKRFQMHDCTPVSTPCEANKIGRASCRERV